MGLSEWQKGHNATVTARQNSQMFETDGSSREAGFKSRFVHQTRKLGNPGRTRGVLLIQCLRLARI